MLHFTCRSRVSCMDVRIIRMAMQQRHKDDCYAIVVRACNRVYTLHARSPWAQWAWHTHRADTETKHAQGSRYHCPCCIPLCQAHSCNRGWGLRPTYAKSNLCEIQPRRNHSCVRRSCAWPGWGGVGHLIIGGTVHRKNPLTNDYAIFSINQFKQVIGWVWPFFLASINLSLMVE